MTSTIQKTLIDTLKGQIAQEIDREIVNDLCAMHGITIYQKPPWLGAVTIYEDTYEEGDIVQVQHTILPCKLGGIGIELTCDDHVLILGMRFRSAEHSFQSTDEIWVLARGHHGWLYRGELAAIVV